MSTGNEELEQRAAVVVSDYDGIVSPQEAFYIHSILYSSGRCLEAFEHFEHMKEQDVQPAYLVALIQEAVGHAAALSRYFWPTAKGSKKIHNQLEMRMMRGQKLRAAFEVDESSALFNRDLRNAWEHFDERLDTYLISHIAGMFYPDAIIDSHTQADDPVNHIFKLLDIEHECLVLLNQKYFYKPIWLEASRIFELANQFGKSGARLPTG